MRRDGYLISTFLGVLILWVLEYMLVLLSVQPLRPIFLGMVGFVLQDSAQRLGFFGAVLLLWGLTLIFVPLLLLGLNSLYIRGLKRRFQENEEEIQAAYALAPPDRFEGYLRKELIRLTNKTALVLLDNKRRCIEAMRLREEAQHAIEGCRLVEAQSSLTSLNELVLREERELREQSNWRRLSIGIMAAYMLLLVLASVALSRTPASAFVPIFGVPYRIIMWAGLGSLAAILYRFYTERKRVRFDLEVRWLIARPIIGIIMGGLAYLALKAGMLLILDEPDAARSPAQAQTLAGAEGLSGRFAVYLIVAFLAGFSDKFYERIIDLLVGKTLGGSHLEARHQPARIRRSGGVAPGAPPHADMKGEPSLAPQPHAATRERHVPEGPPASRAPLQ